MEDRDESDDTRRVRKAVNEAVHQQVAPVEDAVMASFKRVKWWMAAIGSLVALGAVGGFSTLAYLNRYALANDLKTVEVKQEDGRDALQKHILDESARMSALEIQGKVLEAQGRRQEEDSHWTRTQLQRIAETVRAPRVPAPAHATPPRP